MRKIFLLVSCLLINLLVNATVHIQTQPDGKQYAAVLVSGGTSAKYDIVFIGDGFRDVDQALFNSKVNEALAALGNMVPYKTMMCSFNIWRVNVISSESGVDHPKDGISKNTELDCTYGNPALGQAERCVTSASPSKCYEAAGYAPSYDAVFVLVNDSQWGGCEGGLVCSSIAAGFSGIITHELGHKIGNLADEYTCYLCDGTDGSATYSGTEPDVVNLTIETNRTKIKWGIDIDPSTPIPTLTDNPTGVVGLFEGGGYFPKGIYRPQFTCHMLTTGSPFCRVCGDEMARLLSTYCPFRIHLGDFYPTEVPFWKIPSCCFCPLFQDFQTDVVLPEINASDYNAEVVDSRQRVVAKASKTDRGLKLSFLEKGSETYFVRLTPVSKQTAANEIHFHPQVFRDNQAVRLF